jgi:hypothetical protein
VSFYSDWINGKEEVSKKKTTNVEFVLKYLDELHEVVKSAIAAAVESVLSSVNGLISSAIGNITSVEHAKKLVPFDNNINPYTDRTTLEYAQGYNVSGGPDTNWNSYITMLHGNTEGYFTQIASSFFYDAIWWRRKTSGSVQPWHKIAFSEEIPKTYRLNFSGTSVDSETFYNKCRESFPPDIGLNTGLYTPCTGLLLESGNTMILTGIRVIYLMIPMLGFEDKRVILKGIKYENLKYVFSETIIDPNDLNKRFSIEIYAETTR